MNSKFISSFCQDIECVKCENIPLSTLKSRKKLECFYLQCKSENILLFSLHVKSRILSKEIDALEDLSARFLDILQKPFDKKYLIYTSPICSKAKKHAHKLGWNLLHVSL